MSVTMERISKQVYAEQGGRAVISDWAGLEGNAYRQAALAAGADDAVSKATLTTELLLAIRRVMQANRSR